MRVRKIKREIFYSLHQLHEVVWNLLYYFVNTKFHKIYSVSGTREIFNEKHRSFLGKKHCASSERNHETLKQLRSASFKKQTRKKRNKSSWRTWGAFGFLGRRWRFRLLNGTIVRCRQTWASDGLRRNAWPVTSLLQGTISCG